MAALEKIRKRAAILTIVIGAGLLAFILEEAVRASGAFRTDTLALKVGDEKVEIQEFQSMVQAQQQMLQMTNPNQKIEAADLQSRVAQEIIQEKVISQECEETSINVTNNEISKGINEDSQIRKFCSDNFGMEPAVVIEELKKTNDPNIQNIKNYFEQQAKIKTSQLQGQKLAMTVMGCMQPNNVDLALMQENTTPYEIEFVKEDYSKYASNYKVSDNELKDAYNKFKNIFKIDNEQRRLSYIKVDLDPSKKDIEDANKKIAKIYNDFANNEGIKGIKHIDDIHLSIDSTVTRKGKQGNQPAVNELIDGYPGINIKQQNPKNSHDRNTLIYKITNVVECPDSVGVDQVVVLGNNKAKQDSVLAMINSGISTDSIANFYKGDKEIQVAPFVDDNNNKIPAENFVLNQDLYEKLDVVKGHLDTGDFFLIHEEKEGDNAAAVYLRVVKHATSNVMCYTVATATYVNDPSEKTVNDVKGKLEKFINDNNNTASFKKNAQAKGYTAYPFVADASTPKIENLSNTRQAIKWAFDNKPGTVSQIYTSEDGYYLLVVAVDEVYKDYIPLSDPQTREFLTNYVKNKKIGEDLYKKYNGKGKTMQEYAELLKAETVVTTTINSRENQLNQLNDSKVIGRIVGLGNKGIGKIHVIAGNDAIYVVNIKSKKAPEAMTKMQSTAMFQQNYGNLLRGIIMESRKFTNNTIKFS